MPLTDEQMSTPYAELIMLARASGDYVGPGSHTTRWRPDTCGCAIDQTVDGSVVRIQDGRGNVRDVFIADPLSEFRCEHVHEACAVHTATDAQSHFDSVLVENQLKNRFHGAILAELNDQEKDSFEYSWSFDAQRNLVVDTSTVPIAKRATIEAMKRDAVWGGKVK